MTTKTAGRRVSRAARLRWVPLAQMRVNPLAQRDLKPARVSKLAAEMDLEMLGTPTCNQRDGLYYLIDGQHRVEALKTWLGDGAWEDQQIQCWTYEGLTAEEEAERFLKQNDQLTVTSFDQFRVAVQAGRIEENDIDRIVASQGLCISRAKTEGAVMAVAALRKVYHRGPGILARTLRIIRDAYGQPGLEGPIIEGIGLLCQRYGPDIDEETAALRLGRNTRGSLSGGLKGLLNSAELLRQKTGSARSHCIAAAAVDILNRGRGGKKLTSWWGAEVPDRSWTDS